MSGGIATPARHWWPAALVFLLACLPYVETPWFEFVDYDDPEHVSRHDVVSRGLSPRSIAWAFGIGAEPGKDGYFNWPLAWLSHMVDIELFGAWAGGHHVVNVLFHAVNAVLVLALVRRLGLATPAAWLVAAVFAVHPAQVESVAWVSERKTVLCTFFMLLSMLAYLRAHRAGADRSAVARSVAGSVTWFVAWNALGVLALLGKPLAVTLPCVLLLFDVAPLGRIHGPGARAWLTTAGRAVAEKLPLLVCAILDAAWTVAVQSSADAVTPLPWATRLAHATVAYATYLRVFFWPVDLGCIHPHPGMPSAMALIASAALLAVASGLFIAAAWRGRPVAVIGWCWFLGTLVPMVGLVTVGMNGWSDRYLYVPVIGLAVAVLEAGRALGQPLWQHVAGPASEFRDRLPELRRLAIGLGAGWLTALSLASWSLASQWRDTPTLAARTLATSSEPDARWYAWTWLARHHVRQRDYATAEDYFYRAQSVDSDPARAREKLVVWHTAMGRLHMDAQRYAEAVQEFSLVLCHRPDHLEARLGLAVALSRAGEPERAAGLFEEVVMDDPECAVAWVGLGDFHLQAGRAAEAIRCLDRALAIKPDNAGAVTLRAWARVACGDRTGAEADAARRTQLGRPSDPDLLKAIDRMGTAVARPGS